MSDEYNVFISWSGERSRWVAEALRKWLPIVLQKAKPWMSSTNIDKGSRTLNEISTRLNGMKIGIVCLTPENLEAPWILYEAGALSKEIGEKSRLCTYLLGGLEFQDVKAPLGMFQATKPDKQDTRNMIFTINRTLSQTPVPEGDLDSIIDALWPRFENDLRNMPISEQPPLIKREVGDMVAEILEIARAEADTVEAMQAQMTHVEQTLNRAPFGDNGILFTNSLVSGPSIPLSSLAGNVPFESNWVTVDGLGDPRSDVITAEKGQTFRISHSSKDRKK